MDSSFPMRAVWRQVPGALDDVGDRGSSEFALATEKSLVHGWQAQLRFRDVSQFAPCDFSEIDAYAEATEAGERVLITTPGSCPTDALSGWTVVLLRP